MKLGEENPFEENNNEEEEENDKEEEAKKDKGDKTIEETQQRIDIVATTKEQQTEQSVPDTQLPPLSPPHDTSTHIDTITMQDIPNNFKLEHLIHYLQRISRISLTKPLYKNNCAII